MVKMNKGEEVTYDNNLNNMINSLRDTWEANQEISEMKIKDLESKLCVTASRIKGIKTMLKTETSYMTRTVAESLALRKELEEFFKDIDIEDLKKVRQICEILNGYEEY